MKAVKDLHNKNAYLSSGLNLIFNLLVICSEVKSDLKPIHAIFTHYLSDDLDEVCNHFFGLMTKLKLICIGMGGKD